jgi:hypothetical protein
MQRSEFTAFVPRVLVREKPTATEPGTATDRQAHAVEAVRSEPAGQKVEQRVESHARCNPAACEGRVRALAIVLAGRACARALHAAVAKNPLFVRRFVDDALHAASSPSHARVLLCARDAAACGGRMDCDVVSDDALSGGEIVVETTAGLVRATIEQRAEALVRAAADG